MSLSAYKNAPPKKSLHFIFVKINAHFIVTVWIQNIKYILFTVLLRTFEYAIQKNVCENAAFLLNASSFFSFTHNPTYNPTVMALHKQSLVKRRRIRNRNILTLATALSATAAAFYYSSNFDKNL